MCRTKQGLECIAERKTRDNMDEKRMGDQVRKKEVENRLHFVD